MAPSIPTCRPLFTPLRIALALAAMGALSTAASLGLILFDPSSVSAAVASARPEAMVCADLADASRGAAAALATGTLDELDAADYLSR
jgi:hypothetical protein